MFAGPDGVMGGFGAYDPMTNKKDESLYQILKMAREVGVALGQICH